MDIPYNAFIANKKILAGDCGFDISKNMINNKLFDFQKDIVKWSCKKGRAALFTMTGTGKTAMQLEWAKQVHKKTQGRILLLAPLSVSNQTVGEGIKFGINVKHCFDNKDVIRGLNITNYERIHHFDPSDFDGIVLDESSILKAYDGKTRTHIIESFSNTPYRLACTATPSPNDFMELGNHSEFLSVLTRSEMLSMFFVHDGGDTSKWRLKKHAAHDFWRWISSWAVVLEKPSDLGYSDDGFVLPELIINECVIKANKPADGMLFAMPAQTLIERRNARRSTINERVRMCSEIVNSTKDPFLVWCDLNKESELLTTMIPDAKEISGSDKSDYKERTMAEFSNGDLRVLVTKPSIAGFGMNWQHCNNMAFVGLSDSFEQYFQSVRRCWRFGQKMPVNVFIITSELEGNVVENIKRKEHDAKIMIDEMIIHTKNIVSENIKSTHRNIDTYNPTRKTNIPSWLKNQGE